MKISLDMYTDLIGLFFISFDAEIYITGTGVYKVFQPIVNYRSSSCTHLLIKSRTEL